jgi:hypothetical protein
MRCPLLAAQTTLRHDILKGTARRVVHRAGIASALEPTLRRIPGLSEGTRIAAHGSPFCSEARGKSSWRCPARSPSTTSQLSIHFLSTLSHTPRPPPDQQKRTAYARVEPSGYSFVPFSMGAYGRIGHPTMKLLHGLSEEAASPGDVSRLSFVACALQGLSVGFWRGNFMAYRASLGVLARSKSSGYRLRVSSPTDSHVE